MIDEEDFFDLPLVRSILERMRTGLSSSFAYHSLEHTREVLREAVSLGANAGLPARDLELLAIAAAYHDCGFLEQTRDNEALAAATAANAMRESARYSGAEISLVADMIRDTELRTCDGGPPRQIATTRLSPFLLDADLGNLGREDFLSKAAMMLKESGRPDERLFYAELLHLLENHRWYTAEAASLKTEKQQANILKLKQLLADI